MKQKFQSNKHFHKKDSNRIDSHKVWLIIGIAVFILGLAVLLFYTIREKPLAGEAFRTLPESCSVSVPYPPVLWTADGIDSQIILPASQTVNFMPGITGRAYSFSSNYYLQQTSLGISFPPFTVEAWVQLSPAVVASMGTFGIFDVYGTEGNYALRFIPANVNPSWYKKIEMVVYSSDGTLVSRTISGSLDVHANNWYHMVAVFDIDSLKLFVNGVLVGNQSISSPLWSIQGMRIGSYKNTNLFNGLIDEVAVYNQALSDAQVSALYQDCRKETYPCLLEQPSLVSKWTSDDTTMDVKGGNHGTLVGSGAMATYIDSGVINNAFSFDGTGGYVEIPDSPSLTPGTTATFTAWIYVNSLGEDFSSIFNKYSVNDYEFIFGIKESEPKLRFAFHTTGTGAYGTTSFGELTSTGSFEMGTWQQVALVRDGTTITFYINSMEAGTFNGFIDSNPFRDGSNSLRIGAQGRGGYDRFFNGKIDEASIYNVALSASDIRQLYLAEQLNTCDAQRCELNTDCSSGSECIDGACEVIQICTSGSWVCDGGSARKQCNAQGTAYEPAEDCLQGLSCDNGVCSAVCGGSEGDCPVGSECTDGACVVLPFECTGNVPLDAQLCTGDDTDLPANVDRTLAANCGTAKCEYTCVAEFIWFNGMCLTHPTIILSTDTSAKIFNWNIGSAALLLSFNIELKKDDVIVYQKTLAGNCTVDDDGAGIGQPVTAANCFSSNSLDISARPAGIYTMSITATNPGGTNTQTETLTVGEVVLPSTITITPDTTNKIFNWVITPESSITYLNVKLVKNSTLVYQKLLSGGVCTVDEDGAGIGQPVTAANCFSSNSLDISARPAGTYDLAVTAVNAGGTSNAGGVLMVSEVLTPPTVIITPDNTNKIFNWVITPESSITYLSVKLVKGSNFVYLKTLIDGVCTEDVDGAGIGQPVIAANCFSSNSLDISTRPAGTYELSITATNANGTDTKMGTLTVVALPPAITITPDTNNKIFNWIITPESSITVFNVELKKGNVLVYQKTLDHGVCTIDEDGTGSGTAVTETNCFASMSLDISARLAGTYTMTIAAVNALGTDTKTGTLTVSEAVADSDNDGVQDNLEPAGCVGKGVARNPDLSEQGNVALDGCFFGDNDHNGCLDDAGSEYNSFKYQYKNNQLSGETNLDVSAYNRLKYDFKNNLRSVRCS